MLVDYLFVHFLIVVTYDWLAGMTFFDVILKQVPGGKRQMSRSDEKTKAENDNTCFNG